MARYFYRQPVAVFVADALGEDLADRLADAARAQNEGSTGSEERASWRNSLRELALVLRDHLPQGDAVFVELLMPLCSRRCDALLTGTDDHAAPAAVLVELKQWGWARPGTLDEHVLAPNGQHLHPSVQVRTYVQQLRHYHSAWTRLAEGEAPITLTGCAFLHNMAPGPSMDLLRSSHFPQQLEFRVFGREDAAALGAFIQQRVGHGPGEAVAERVANGKPAPSKRLMDVLVEVIHGSPEYQLVDEQRTVLHAALLAVRTAVANGERSCIVVRGGPGTGKSVLAVQLLAQLAGEGRVVAHATGSKAFSTVLKGKTMAFARQKLMEIWRARKRGDVPVDDLFTTFADIAREGERVLSGSAPLAIDLTVCDEAHRLWQHRRIVYPNGTVKWLTDRSMVEEVLAASRVTVCFIDDNQAVRAGEIGHSRMILAAAERLGIRVTPIDLTLQFRCSGSEGWIRWVDNLLGFGGRADLDWRDGEYQLACYDDPAQMQGWLEREAASGARCRLVAGFCWPWSKPDPLTGLPPHDITIGAWSAPWIEKTGKDLRPMDNQYYKWATDDRYLAQVGSIYSAQGFEFDRVGVIWGPDLVWRDDRWVAQLEQSRDRAFIRELRREGGDPVVKLRNIYRVLLTRGMLSTGLHIVDEVTRAHVQNQLVYRAGAVANGRLA